MIGQQLMPRLRAATLPAVAVCLWSPIIPLSAQCQVSVCVDTYDDMRRLSGNSVQGSVSSTLIGTGKNFWSPGVTGQVYRESQLLQVSPEVWGPYGGTISYTFSPLTLSQQGPGLWTTYGYHRAYCPTVYCGYERYAPPYGDGWDGWDGWQINVVRPTFSGFGSGGAMWYLGPGTASQVPAQDGSYYYQAYGLTFNSNCDPPSACTETPQWTLSNTQQVELTNYTGATTTIRSKSFGNCQWSTTLKASIGGFESDAQPFAVNSPTYLVSQGVDFTAQWGSGYQSEVHWAVADACTPAQAMIGLPFHEVFGQFFNPGVVQGWPDPPETSAALFNYTSYVFRDFIGANDPSYNPVPTWWSYSSPYAHNTVLKYGSQSWRVGTQVRTQGIEVFSGTLRYYRDHGTSNW